MNIIKKSIYIFFTFLISLAVSILTAFPASASQQSNFQIAPSPIAYPFFEDGRFDGEAGITFISITMQNFNMAGGDFGGKVRSALSDYIAIDGTLGMVFLGGSMRPGLVPISYISGTNPAKPGDEAKLALLGIRGSMNLELQPVHTAGFDVILFGGPQFTFTNFTITSDYSIWNGSYYKTGYQDKLSINSRMGGFQAGIQMDFNFGSDLRISPFVMITSSSGTATMTDDPQLVGYSSKSYTFDIPKTTSTSIGMDIIFGDMSIGAILQQMKKTENSSENTKIIMVSLSYHFSSAGNDSGQGNAGTTDESI